MTTHIAILRGINVGGHRKIQMEYLRNALEEIGFATVKTYIQSGNIIFDTATTATDLEIAERIEKTILTNFGFTVPAIVRSRDELQQALTENPFLKGNEHAIENLHLTFLKETPTEEALQKLSAGTYPPDEFKIIGKNIFLAIPGPYHKTKLSNAFFEKKLGVSATTRNWKTVQKLAEIS